MGPKYLVENRYAFVLDAARELTRASFEVDSAETAFERDIQRRLIEANRLLQSGRHSAAIQEYQSLRGVMATILYPPIPPYVGVKVEWAKLVELGIADVAIAKSAQMLDRTPAQQRAIPATLQTEVPLGAEVRDVFAAVEGVGLADADEAVRGSLAEMQAAAAAGDFKTAAAAAGQAARQAKDAELVGALLHDQALLTERGGDGVAALELMQASVKSFDTAEKRESQVAALGALAAMQTRRGDPSSVNATLRQVEEVRTKFSVFEIRKPVTPVVEFDMTAQPRRLESIGTFRHGGLGFGGLAVGGGADAGAADAADGGGTGTGGGVALMSLDAFQARKTAKTMTVVAESGKSIRIKLPGGATDDLSKFYATLRDTNDIGLLTGYLGHHTTTVTYLAHLIGWVLPMAIGDCHLALGAFAEAETEYRSTLGYKYLNKAAESVTVWLRLADLYLEWGDRLYRDAANVVDDYAEAAARYALLIKPDDTIDGSSPLYASPAFADMATRVNAIVQAVVAGGESDDNPRITIALARARLQLHKIAHGLNFLGMGRDVPPFAFEHLQNLARYFAQHAAQVEQGYIQFQSSGENETLREQQMAQQATLAEASVELERRGLSESREGVDVASANLNSSIVQRANAQEMKNRFDAVRWELQELDRLQAWAGSASNDEVKLNVRNATYYSADSKPRSHVLFDLANRRAQISHDLEAARMQNEIEAADAYIQVADQQVQQARARVAVAEQRVQIAGLQAQYARENLDFLTGREFSSTMWYDLAREARRIARRYLDTAIEVAVLMERAYEAETGRDLRTIKLDYGLASAGGLLGGDALLLDIDSFSLDFVRTKAKKSPMKLSLSMADQFPMAFDQLVRTGRAMFETTLEHFDRRYPGFYLQKLKQVELLFLGLAGTEGVHGTLRNIGLSKFRQRDGTTVTQTYPADVMPLTDYDVRQDAIVFQLGANELRLFENNGIATVWQLEVPTHSNTFDLSQILDVQIVLYYDGFFDAGLEQTTLASLPVNGSGTRSFSLRLTAPDELFFLRSEGRAELELDARLLPANQADPRLRAYHLQARGPAAAGLKIRVDWAGLGSGHLFTLDANGNADGASFAGPVGRSLLDTMTFSVTAADNPQLVADGVLDLSGLLDLAVFVDYEFTYRTAA